MDDREEVTQRGKWPIRPIWIAPTFQKDVTLNETLSESSWTCLEIQEETSGKFRYLTFVANANVFLPTFCEPTLSRICGTGIVGRWCWTNSWKLCISRKKVAQTLEPMLGWLRYDETFDIILISGYSTANAHHFSSFVWTTIRGVLQQRMGSRYLYLKYVRHIHELETFTTAIFIHTMSIRIQHPVRLDYSTIGMHINMT